MSLDTYTQNIPLTQKARFWSNYVAALKGKKTNDFSRVFFISTHPSLPVQAP